MKQFCPQIWAPPAKNEELEGSKHLERSETKLGMGENDVGVEANAAAINKVETIARVSRRKS